MCGRGRRFVEFCPRVGGELLDEVFQQVERNLGSPLESIPRDVLAAFVWPL